MLADEMLALTTKGSEATAARGEGATLRERFHRTMACQGVDRLPNWEFGYWEETLAGWHAQGLPPEVKDEASAYAYFGIEGWGTWAPVNVMGLVPGFGWTKLAEDEEHITYRDHEGAVARINRHGHKSIPHFLEFAVKDRASWERFREHLRPDLSRVGGDREDACIWRLPPPDGGDIATAGAEVPRQGQATSVGGGDGAGRTGKFHAR